jgi:hypothetical protein
MSDEMKNIIKKLNGVAAVNLSEPSEGDLERVANAYREVRAKLAEKDAEIAALKFSIEDFKTGVNNFKCVHCGDYTSPFVPVNLMTQLAEARELIKEASVVTDYFVRCPGGARVEMHNRRKALTTKLDAWLKGDAR